MISFITQYILGWGIEIVTLGAALAAVLFTTYDKETKRLTRPGRYLLPVIALAAIAKFCSSWLSSEEKSRNAVRDAQSHAEQLYRLTTTVAPQDIVAHVSHQIELPTSREPKGPQIFSQKWRLKLTVSPKGDSREPTTVTLYPEVYDNDYVFVDHDDFVTHKHHETETFIGKYADLRMLSEVAAWNGATVSVSLEPPPLLNLDGIKYALGKNPHLPEPDEPGIEPHIQALPQEITISLYVKNRQVGVTKGFWSQGFYADETAERKLVETYANIRVPENAFLAPVPELAKEHPMRPLVAGVGLLAVLGSVALIILAFTSEMQTVRKIFAKAPEAA